MIKPIAMVNKLSYIQKDIGDSLFNYNNVKREMTPQIDSFKKYTQETKPALLTIATGWTIYDIVSKTRSFPKSIVCNYIGFFIPALIASSAILSFVENKKPSKSSI